MYCQTLDFVLEKPALSARRIFSLNKHQIFRKPSSSIVFFATNKLYPLFCFYLFYNFLLNLIKIEANFRPSIRCIS